MKPQSKLRGMLILFIACICGWFVMELEILGVRMLAPYFGSAVYVVTGSVIGVFLLSLSVGYMLGGWLSTKAGWQAILGSNLLITGLWLMALPFLTEPVCDTIFRLDLDEKWGSLIASLILFGLPTSLMGTVSPTVIHWLGTQFSGTGFNAGLVLASSTVASFAGCVITAFYLVLLSMRQTLIVSGIIVSILGILITLFAIASRKKQDSKWRAEVQSVEAAS
jgi:MFS family permease